MGSDDKTVQLNAQDVQMLRTLSLMRTLDMSWHQIQSMPVDVLCWYEAFESGRRNAKT